MKVKVVIATKNSKIQSDLSIALKASDFEPCFCEPNILMVEMTIMKYKPNIVILMSEDFKTQHNNHGNSLVKNMRSIHKVPIIINLYIHENQTEIENLEVHGVTSSFIALFNFVEIVRYMKKLNDELPLDVEKGYLKIRHKISEILNMLNFNNSMQGYNYILEAIYIVSSHSSRKTNFSKNIYPNIAQKFETSKMSVERAMRVAINYSWKKTNENVYGIFFNKYALKNSTKPTNNEFVTIIADLIHDEFSDFFKILNDQKSKEDAKV